MLKFNGFKPFSVSWLILLGLLVPQGTAFSNWTLNLGYHNPPGATVGFNFLYWGNPLIFEVGIGWIDVDTLDEPENDDTSSTPVDAEDEEDGVDVAVAGAINLKYLLSQGTIKPYLQLGTGAGTRLQAGDQNDIDGGFGGLYGGIGLLAGDPGFYAYGAYNINSHENSFIQAGIGFDL
jgi:hypothetical protein